MKQRLAFLLLSTIINVASQAQQIRPADAAQIYNEIAQLKKLTHVLYLAAHPDDENTRLLAWLVNDRHIPTTYLSLTRGDGGQNILGSEQGAALGLIRTHELLEARKMDGAGQCFTRAIDFGFSKTPEETFKHWNQYTITSDIVRMTRKYRPDVIICRFPPDSRAGHGQHAASATLAEKAFQVAGDKLQYTEQLKYFSAWQPKRILWNTFRFSSTNTTSEDQFKIEVGNYSPLLGMGYGELAGKSRSIHRSQGAGTPSTPGVQKEYFTLVAGDTMANSLFDGLDITWNRVGRPEIGKQISVIQKQFDFTHPENSLPDLLDLRKKIETVKDEFWRVEKLKQLDDVILHAAGVMIDATTKQPQAVAGSTLPFQLRIISRSSVPIVFKNINWPQGDSLINFTLAYDSLYSLEHNVTIPVNQSLTEPYWMENPVSNKGQFPVNEDQLIGLPETPNRLTVNVSLTIGGTPYSIPVPLSYKKLDPKRGDIIEQLRIVPDVSIEPFASLLITKPDGSVNSLVRIHSFNDVKDATLTIYGNNKELLKIPKINFKNNSDTTIPFTITSAMSKSVKEDEYFLDMELTTDKKKYNKTLRLIQYDHIPTLQYFTPPAAKLIRNDWKVTAKKIGFVEGAGDYTATLLKLAGLQVEMLNDADLADAAKLKSFDVIITGIRAVNTEKKMSYWLPVLFQYVQNGGTLIMQYNTLQDLATTQLGPFPMTLSNKRVTEENAKVEFLLPQHRLLNYPNKITSDDFDNWVQERGLYFPSKWDEKYQTLFRMNDSGEEPLDGALLYAPYGKGHFIYSSLAFFRQLPAGNKGAIRLLTNMMSVGK